MRDRGITQLTKMSFGEIFDLTMLKCILIFVLVHVYARVIIYLYGVQCLAPKPFFVFSTCFGERFLDR